MDYSTNLKRRRDSGDSIIEEGERHIKKPPQTETQTQSQTPSLTQPKGEKKITRPERPAQIIPPPQSTPAHLPDFPFSPKTPSLSLVTTPQPTYSVPFGDPRNNTPSTIITHCSKAAVTVSFKRSSTCADCISLL